MKLSRAIKETIQKLNRLNKLAPKGYQYHINTGMYYADGVIRKLQSFNGKDDVEIEGELLTFEVWSAWDHEMDVHYWGTWEGESFKEACAKCFAEEKRKAKGKFWENYYDEEENRYWALRLFDNEVEARATESHMGKKLQ